MLRWTLPTEPEGAYTALCSAAKSSLAASDGLSISGVLCRRQDQFELQALRVVRLDEPVCDVKRPSTNAVHAKTDKVLHLNSCRSQLPFRHSSFCKQSNAHRWQLLGLQTRILRGQSMRTSRSHRGTELYLMTPAASQQPQSRAVPTNAASSSCKVP